jgi:hypothetical protein
MAITGRWPRAIFYDSKTALFNWAGSWRGAAAVLWKKHDAQVDEQAFVETWVRGFEGLHRRAAFFRYTQVTDLAREALGNAYRMHGIIGSPDDIDAFLDLQARVELLEARDVLYCAAPMFDIQGAMSAGMVAAWLRRPEGRLSKETHTAGDLAADFEVESLHDVTRLVERIRG